MNTQTLKDFLSKAPRGTAKQMAVDLDISPSMLSQIAAGTVPVSAERAVDIEKVSQGKVSRKTFFPNNWKRIWPELADAA